MYIIGFVLYHLLFMVVTLLLPLPYRLYSLTLCMGFFLIFLLIVPYLKLPEHHLWSYYLWTITFLFQSLMWWMFFYYDEITYDMMYLCQAVWCTSLTFVVTGCSCFYSLAIVIGIRILSYVCCSTGSSFNWSKNPHTSCKHSPSPWCHLETR